jgi:hypothetical protein
MVLPGSKVHVQPRDAQLSSVTVVDLFGEFIGQPPRSAGYILPRDTDSCLRSRLREIHDDEMMLFALSATPRDQIPIVPVVGPSVSFTKLPRSILEVAAVDRLPQAARKLLELLISRLILAPGKKHRRFHYPSILICTPMP